MKIRFAETEDQERIVEIYNQAVATGISTADLAPTSVDLRSEWFAGHSQNSYPIYVEEIESRVAGWCSLSPYRPGRLAVRHTAEISYYVGNEYQRRGVASRLIQHAIEDSARLNIKTFFGILLDTNTPSERLLLKLGFERWGHLPNVADFNGKECGHLYLGKRIR